jgi:hypothetical protein
MLSSGTREFDATGDRTQSSSMIQRVRSADVPAPGSVSVSVLKTTSTCRRRNYNVEIERRISTASDEDHRRRVDGWQLQLGTDCRRRYFLSANRTPAYRCRSRWRCIARSRPTARRPTCMWLRVKGIAGTSCATACSSCRSRWNGSRDTFSTVSIPGKKLRPADARSPTRLVANAIVVFPGPAHIELRLRNFSQVFRPRKFQGKVGRFEPRTLTAQI